MQWIFIKATWWKSWLLSIKKSIGKKWWLKYSREINTTQALSRGTLVLVRKKTCYKKLTINTICTFRNPFRNHNPLKPKYLSRLQFLPFISLSNFLIISSKKISTMSASNILILTRTIPQLFWKNSIKYPNHIQSKSRANKKLKSKALESPTQIESLTFRLQSLTPIFFQSRKSVPLPNLTILSKLTWKMDIIKGQDYLTFLTDCSQWTKNINQPKSSIGLKMLVVQIIFWSLKPA